VTDGEAQRADHHGRQNKCANDAAARHQQAEAGEDFRRPGDYQKPVAEADRLELLNHQARAGELGVSGGDRDHAEQDLRCVDADGLVMARPLFDEATLSAASIARMSR